LRPAPCPTHHFDELADSAPPVESAEFFGVVDFGESAALLESDVLVDSAVPADRGDVAVAGVSVVSLDSGSLADEWPAVFDGAVAGLSLRLEEDGRCSSGTGFLTTAAAVGGGLDATADDDFVGAEMGGTEAEFVSSGVLTAVGAVVLAATFPGSVTGGPPTPYEPAGCVPNGRPRPNWYAASSSPVGIAARKFLASTCGSGE
jgi:hypothetical protein